MASPYNDDWEGADALLKSLKALATPRRPLSASKVNTVAETAIQHVKEYKRVVHAIERFIRKEPPHHRIGGCFVIDSLCRQSQLKWKHKDVFAPRFAKRLVTETIPMLREVPDEDKGPVFRTIRAWHEKAIFQGLEVFTDIVDGAGGNGPIPSTGTTLPPPETHQSDRGREGKGGGALQSEDGGQKSGNSRPRLCDGGALDEPLSDSKYVPEEPPLTPDVVPTENGVGRGSATVVSRANGTDEPSSNSRFVPKEPPLPPEANPPENRGDRKGNEGEQRTDRSVNRHQPQQRPKDHGSDKSCDEDDLSSALSKLSVRETSRQSGATVPVLSASTSAASAVGSEGSHNGDLVPPASVGHSGLSRVSSRCDDDDLTSAMSKLSVRETSSDSGVTVPALAAFSYKGSAVAGEHVRLMESVGTAEPIPTNYREIDEYLEAMQAHTQLEFEASIKQGLLAAERRKDGGWLNVTCKQEDANHHPERISFCVDGRKTNGPGAEVGGHNFKTDPWTRHAIQFEGEAVPALVVKCRDGPTDYQAYLTIAGTGTNGRSGVPLRDQDLQTRVRSLGYVGSFLREYSSAADLLAGARSSPLLSAVTAPGQHQGEGTFVPADDATIDTSRVPLNSTQRRAVTSLSGGLDIVIGPPGTGKSTTIWHIINSRVAHGARTLVTCTRNQAIDAVTRKVESFGVLVFGSDMRLGEFTREFTIEGRMRNDPELVFWRRQVESWRKAYSNAMAVSWTKLHLSSFPGIQRLRDIHNNDDTAGAFSSRGDQAEKLKKRRAAGLWIVALTHVLHEVYMLRLKNGTKQQQLTYKQACAFQKWRPLLKSGLSRAGAILARLEVLTRYRIYAQTRVLLCTVDSSERMVREMEEGTFAARRAVGSSAARSTSKERLEVDTAIMDEAACVLETAVPVILALGVKNLTLIGDQHQLQPFSQVRADGGNSNHSRSLMERAIDAGAASQFLEVQYRMHPAICEMISSTFYKGKLTTADETALVRQAPVPLRWINVTGGELKHQGRGYSNPREVPEVVNQAREAIKMYGSSAEIRVITFYNMQKNELEREFKKHDDLSRVHIASVDACQGSDADVVIISTVRSGGVGYPLSGFMLDHRRVNVALSRAREECIVVGDKRTLGDGGGKMWRSVVDHFRS